MQLAERARTPFWPASSIFDTPLLILHWHAIAAEAEARAQDEIARKRERHTA